MKGTGFFILHPSAFSWPEEAQEPIYLWNNTVNGSVRGMVSGSPHIHAGINFYKGRARPGYVAYRYPHPLATR